MSEKYIGYRKIFIKWFLKISNKSLKKSTKAKLNKKTIFSDKEKFILKIGQILAELESQLELLNFFPVFINSSSYNLEKKGFSKIAQFRYHLECYFSEMYILDQRLDRLMRILTKNIKAKTEKEKLNIIRRKQHQIFDNLLKVGGFHVHKRKYQDDDLYHMGLLEQYMKSNIDIKNIKKKNYAKKDLKIYLNNNRSKWKKTINNNNKYVKDGIDKFYHLIFKELKILDKIFKYLS
ncbi:MAG: hypothetical protein U9Q85_04510 [Patescibacteria group bacterium]|nr:hypothetical protein [Patescibacteria group bacterium]